MSENPPGVEEIGMSPWVNVRYRLCDECKEREEHCWYIKGQWLCMICRLGKYGKGQLNKIYKRKLREVAKARANA